MLDQQDVSPVPALSSRRKPTMTSTSVGRRPAITSSSSSSLGSVASARATSSFLRSGKVRLSASWSRRSARPSRFRMPSAAARASASARPAMQGADRDVLQNAQSLEGPHDLEGPADACVAHAIGPQAGDLPSVEPHRAGARRMDAGDHVEDRGLARAVGTDQRVDRAGRHGEADVVHGAQAAEGLAQAVDLEARAAHLRPIRAASHGHTPAGRYITMASRARP